jgi:hypothetical protein
MKRVTPSESTKLTARPIAMRIATSVSTIRRTRDCTAPRAMRMPFRRRSCKTLLVQADGGQKQSQHTEEAGERSQQTLAGE